MAKRQVQDTINDTVVALREEVGSESQWSREELLRYIYEALCEISERHPLFVKRFGIEVTAEKAKYFLSDEIIEIIRVEYDGEPLSWASYDELDAIDTQWRSKDGEVLAFLEDVVEEGYVELYKRPDTSGDVHDFSSDYGMVSDISDSTHTYTFATDYGCITGIDSDGDDFYDLDQDYGIVTEMIVDTDNLLVIASVYPDEISEASYLPRPFHRKDLILRYYAMGQALSKSTDKANQQLAALWMGKYQSELQKVATRKKGSRRRKWSMRPLGYDFPRDTVRFPETIPSS